VQLGNLLGSGYTVTNCGASGTCMVKGDVRATYWKTKQFQDALNFDPQIVIIKLGTNDGDPQGGVRIKISFIRTMWR
jgi:acyl-CoA thioesterase-1